MKEKMPEFRKHLPPEVQGLGFSILKSTDYEALYSVASDPAIWDLHPDRERYTKEGFRKFFNKAMMDDCLPYLLMDSEKSEAIGSSRFYAFNDEEKTVFVGFTFLATAYWGGTWNSRLKLAMLSHAFRHFNTVYFEAGINNLRSVNALQKLGALQVPSVSAEKVLFQISAEQWPLIREKLEHKLGIPNI